MKDSHDPDAFDAHGPAARRGAMPVGHIDDFSPLEAAAVVCLRLCGAAAGCPHRRQFEADLGRHGGFAALAAAGRLSDLCEVYGRRALMRHHVSCRHVGADEACLARLVDAAARGERDDAMLIATLIVRADVAAGLVCEAEQAAAALARIAGGPPPGPLH
ncbi:MAG: hypothetical protein KDK10_05735 [Maritimibacter sp.]|nr:hypothetical protein [Maritimibacter sp.]